MTSNDPQPDLPALAQPRVLVVGGDDLAATLAKLRKQGGRVLHMDVDRASYTLHIFWPRCSCELCTPQALPSDAAVPLLQTRDDAPQATPDGKNGHSSKESLCKTLPARHLAIRS